jgi:uncharacterized protein YqgC (DUF456 family)
MHEAVSNSRDLVILFNHDYLQSPYTRKEFGVSNFAQTARLSIGIVVGLSTQAISGAT